MIASSPGLVWVELFGVAVLFGAATRVLIRGCRIELLFGLAFPISFPDAKVERVWVLVLTYWFAALRLAAGWLLREPALVLVLKASSGDREFALPQHTLCLGTVQPDQHALNRPETGGRNAGIGRELA